MENNMYIFHIQVGLELRPKEKVQVIQKDHRVIAQTTERIPIIRYIQKEYCVVNY